MALRGSQRAVLRAIDESPTDSAGYVSDEQVSSLTEIAIIDVKDWLITLEDDGLVSLSRKTNGFWALMEARGRIELREHQERLKYRKGSVNEVVEKEQPKIKPKGLASFDREDADFFLELLPGPYGREGLPDSVSFWKIRIESKDPDCTFQVGVVYGPSGCGKSSLVKAGLLPRLTSHVLPVYVEATGTDTEISLLKGLRRRCPDLPPDLGLTDSVSLLQGDQSLTSGKKVLLFIDQFEQWLLAKHGEKGTELVEALRHCDEERVQTIVIVRDDFLSAAIEFMDELGTEFRPSLNARRVDLFTRPHAKKVLAAFGQSYRVLGDDLTLDQQSFLNQAVDGLVRDGIIIPVRLALFAEMLKSREWTPKTLKEIGGMEGVGIAFLEETFSSSYADPRHRPHQDAARSVLKALLSESGTNIKGPKRSRDELLKVSGYSPNPSKFEELIRILDTELRLITPTASDDTTGDDQPTTPHGDQYYQLTHDYLVPSLREWLTRKQRETRRGRAELLLAERSAVWSSKPENRQLPSILEWLRIRSLTRRQGWTEEQTTMMRRAGWVRGGRLLISSLFMTLVGWGLFEWNGRTQAQARTYQLLEAAAMEDVPEAIQSLIPYWGWVKPLLMKVVPDKAESKGDEEKKLRACLALLQVDKDDRHVPYVKDRLFRAEAQDIKPICEILASQKGSIVDECWRVLTEPKPEDRGKALQAASALALYDRQSLRWANIRADVANRLVTVNPFVAPRWVDALRPVATQLSDSLLAVSRDGRRGETERTSAASALAEYCADQPAILANLIWEATEAQFVALYPKVAQHADQTAPLLGRILDEERPPIKGEIPTDVEEAAWDDFYKRQANAAVALIRMGRREKSWALMKHSPDPSLRSYLVHRLGPLGLDAGLLLRSLESETEVSIRRALILSLGEYEESRISTAERKDWENSLLDLYRHDPDPGIHGAADWVLRQWGHEKDLQAIDKELAKLPLSTKMAGPGEAASQESDRLWYVNSLFQTMTVVRGPVEFIVGQGKFRHSESIDHGFAIAAEEVTVNQYREFIKETSGSDIKYNEKTSPVSTCPMNSVSWYDAAAYCNWLSRKERLSECYAVNEKMEYSFGMKLLPDSQDQYRKGYRLPTVTEWEYACRSRAETSFAFGEPVSLLAKYGHYLNNYSNYLDVFNSKYEYRSWPVGILKPNDLGLFDLHGNVSEWCQVMNDKENNNIIRNGILRGGSFTHHPADLRSAVYTIAAPSRLSSDYGFRPARTYP
jgi:formylglycine-generating enzyme required for sulfatase activity